MQTDIPDRILRLKAILECTGISRSTMYRKMNGIVLKNMQIGTRCADWRESAINTWQRNPMFYSLDELLAE